MGYVRKNDDKEKKCGFLKKIGFNNIFNAGIFGTCVALLYSTWPKANFPQEATFFILCHRFFLHSSLFKSCCHTTFEYLSHCWDWASLLERAATAAASQQLTELKFKLGREALSTQQSCKKNWWQTNFKHLF